MNKQAVEAIFQERHKNDANSNALATTLNQWIESVFNDYDRIFYEILQNADDAVQQVEEEGFYEVHLFDKYLIINYDGRHFDTSDLQSLCGVANSNKVTLNNKIGYKGIGFKSVFKISDCVWIVSNNTCIRFDKNYNKQGANGYPWQLIPIWTELSATPTDISDLIKPQNISIIIEIKNSIDVEKTIKNSLNKIYGDYNTILFLRNIKEIQCFRHQKETLTVLKDYDSKNGITSIEVLKAKSNKNETWRFLTYPIEIEIPQHIQHSLQLISDCPEKLKNATKTQITLAARLDEGKSIISERFTPIYCYLPTDIKKEIPYHINAEFLTTPDRKKLYSSNNWNDWLFENVGYHQFEWVKQLVEQGKFKVQIPALIREKYLTLLKKDEDYSIKEAFNTGVEKAVKGVSFLPEYQSNNLMLIEDGIVDKTTYSFESDEAATLVLADSMHHYKISHPKLIDPQIENIEKLIKLGAKDFNIMSLCRLLESEMGKGIFLNPSKNEQLIHFFAATIGGVSDVVEKNLWNAALSETNFLLTSNETLRSPLELYFPTDQNDFLIPIEVSFLDKKVYQGVVNNKRTIDWLKEIQVKDYVEVELIEREILGNIIAQENLNHQNIIELTRFVFKHYYQLKDDVKQKVKDSLNVLTQNNQIIAAPKAYLAKIYNPILPIEGFGTAIEILSEDYIEEVGNSKEIGKWNRFFSELGVQKQMSIKPCKETNPEQLKKEVPYAVNYFNYLKNDLGKAVLKIENLFYITFTEELQNKDFALLFWDRLLSLDVITNVLLKEQKIRAVTSLSKNEQLPSLFKYYVQNYPSFPTINHGMKPTLGLYSFKLKNWANSSRPISSIEMDAEIEHYLGIHTTLNLDDHLELLTSYSLSSVTEDVQMKVQKVYAEMENARNNYTTEQKEKIKKWAQTNKLLAENNCFQEVDKLYFLDIEGFREFKTAENNLFVKLETRLDNRIDFCKLFDIKVLQRNDLVIEKENPSIDNALTLLLEWLAEPFAIDFVTENGGVVEDKKNEIQAKIAQLTCFNCTNIHLEHRAINGTLIYQTPIVSWVEEDNLFYKKNWITIEVLYALVPQLCTFLSLNSREREVQLMLMSGLENVYKWFHLEKPKEEFQEPNLAYSPLIDDSKEDSKKLNKPNGASSVQENKKIGCLGEQYVYHYLIDKYKKQKSVVVEWMNEHGECGEPYDLIIKEKEMITYVEVKTTAKEDACTKMNMSKEEHRFMQENEGQYKIYRVSNINQEPQLEILSWGDLTGYVLKDGYWLGIEP